MSKGIEKTQTEKTGKSAELNKTDGETKEKGSKN